jgi:hypothetical protein
MPYCKERLECRHFDPAGCDAEVGTGCFEEIDNHQTAEISPSNSSGLLAERKMLIKLKCWADGKILQKVGATRKFDKGYKYALEDLVTKLDEVLSLDS